MREITCLGEVNPDYHLGDYQAIRSILADLQIIFCLEAFKFKFCFVF